MSSPKVQRVRSNADVAKVYFTDGHVAVFVANQGGWGEPTSIERFWLEHEQRTAAMFHSRYQYPSTTARSASSRWRPATRSTASPSTGKPRRTTSAKPTGLGPWPAPGALSA